MTIPHWIAGNDLTRQPNRWVWLDTESIPTEQAGITVHEWRLAVTCLDRRDSSTAPWKEPTWCRHTDPVQMWETISTYCIASQRTMLVAHNSGFDARISQSFTVLPQLGWELNRWQIGDRSLMVKWVRDGCSLQLADSTGWFPMALAKVGSLIGTEKLDLPPFEADDDPWWARCERDVAIMRTAMMLGMAWVKEENLGNWAPTAGSMAWNNWRHRHLTHKVFVHDDEQARTAERAAAAAGRCEAWRHGQLPAGRWSEWDFPLAYPRAARDVLLPVKLLSRVQHPSAKAIAARGTRSRWLIRAQVATDVPTLPVHLDGRHLWPVGRLAGWWWDDELDLAVAHGATVRAVEALRYQAQPALRQWADWIIDQVEGDGPARTDLQRAVAKVWARALIGRFAVRYRSWEDWGPATQADTAMGMLIRASDRKLGRLFTVAGRDLGTLDEVDGEQTAPAVMSAVMAESRIRLWHLMSQAGFDHVAYVDTDSAIVDNVGDARLRALSATDGLHGARVKGVWDSLTVMGPRQLVVGGGHRISGVSGHAERLSPTEWAGERFEGVEASLSAGRPNGVRITPTLWKVEGVDHRREHLAGGLTGCRTIDMWTDK